MEVMTRLLAPGTFLQNISGTFYVDVQYGNMIELQAPTKISTYSEFGSKFSISSKRKIIRPKLVIVFGAARLGVMVLHKLRETLP
ncbi:unnamed protein product [Lupinus luteus]|uniref:Uncharacterized protein n=1 Tax=Lupinus luteus TaxID=3873 RepID=A0AAV1X5V5_LUPLU